MELTQEIKTRLMDLSERFSTQTQEEYISGELSTILMDEIFPLVYKLDGDVLWRRVNTVWYSSKMSDKKHTALTLALLAETL